MSSKVRSKEEVEKWKDDEDDAGDDDDLDNKKDVNDGDEVEEEDNNENVNNIDAKNNSPCLCREWVQSTYLSTPPSFSPWPSLDQTPCWPHHLSHQVCRRTSQHD